MEKYRASGPVESEPAESAQDEQTPAPPGSPHAHPRMQAWECLTCKFSDNGGSAADSTTSIEEEFRQYSTTMISRLGSIDSLEFWHVGHNL